MNDNKRLLEKALSGYQLTQVLITLHELGVATQLHQNTQDITSLSAILGTDSRSLWQLLASAEKIGVIKKNTQDHYQLTKTGLRLLPEREDSIIPFLDVATVSYPAWGRLTHSIQTAKSAFNKVYGIDIYDYLAQHPSKNTSFNRYMAQTTDIWLKNAGKYYDFKGHLIDLGGNKGAFSAMLLQQFPNLKATVFDLSQAVEQAPAVLKEAKVINRCQVKAGSFFEADSIPKKGDIYLISRVLLNWNDDSVIDILRNCRRAMPKNSKLLILEFVLTEKAELRNYLSSLNLLAVFGALIRTKSEYENLLEIAGFKNMQWIPIGTDEKPLFYLEASPC